MRKKAYRFSVYESSDFYHIRLVDAKFATASILIDKIERTTKSGFLGTRYESNPKTLTQIQEEIQKVKSELIRKEEFFLKEGFFKA